MRNVNWVYFIYGLFALIGTGLIIGCIFLTVSNIKFDQNAVEITGTIVDIETYRDMDGDRHRRAYVDYEYEEREYRHVELGFYLSTMRLGKEITVKIDPDDPGRAKASGESLFGSIIMGIMGIVFSAFGYIPMINDFRNRNRTKELRERGRYIYATVERVDINYNYSSNGKNPFVLYCYYEDEYSGIIYKFKSDNIWTDPSLVFSEGSKVRVFVKENDYSNYHVDVMSSLQKRIVDYT